MAVVVRDSSARSLMRMRMRMAKMEKRRRSRLIRSLRSFEAPSHL